MSTKSLTDLPLDTLLHAARYLTLEETARLEGSCKTFRQNQNHLYNIQTRARGLNLRPGVQEATKFDIHILRIIAMYDDYVHPDAKSEFTNPHHPYIDSCKKYMIEQYGEPGDIPRIPARIHDFLMSPSPFTPNLSREETHYPVFAFKGFEEGRKVVTCTSLYFMTIIPRECFPCQIKRAVKYGYTIPHHIQARITFMFEKVNSGKSIIDGGGFIRCGDDLEDQKQLANSVRCCQNLGVQTFIGKRSAIGNIEVIRNDTEGYHSLAVCHIAGGKFEIMEEPEPAPRRCLDRIFSYL